MKNRILILHLHRSIDFPVIIRTPYPRRARSKSRILRPVPLHRSTPVIPGPAGKHLQRLLLRFTPLQKNLIIIQTLHIPVLADIRIIGICHSQLFPLINIGSSPKQMDSGCKHLGGFLPVFSLLSQPGNDSRLIMVAPENSIPPVIFLHSQLPLFKNRLQLPQIRFHQLPLIAILVIHLKMMKTKTHGKLFFLRIGITDAVLQRSGGHFPHRHQIPNPRIRREFLQEFMHMPPIRIKPSAIPLPIILPDLRFGNQIHHIKPESPDSFFFPEKDNLFQFHPNLRIFPVQIRLRHIKQMKIPLPQMRHILPGRAPEFGFPVRRRPIRLPVPEKIVIHILLLPCQSPPEPFMLSGGMIKHHIKHQPYSPVPGLLCQHLQILHGTEYRIHTPVIRHIITIIFLRGTEKRRQPKIIHSQLFQIIQPADDPF